MWAVLDPNVLISALLASSGAAADVLRSWQRGEFELVTSPLALEELERASATVLNDSDEEPPIRSADPGDDYLIALAASRRAILVSGDKHLLDLAQAIPVESPGSFLDRLATWR